MARRMGWVAGAAVALVPLLCGAASPAATQAPPQGGTITIEAHTADGSVDPAMPAFVGAATEALTDRGFTILDSAAHTAYVAELIVSQAAVGTGMGRDPDAEKVSVGAGLMVPLSTGNSNVITLRRSRLELRIHKRGDTGVVWSGAAVTVRPTGSAKGSNATVAADLSAALLRGYPAVPEDVVGVP
ncbi:hypothetical protein [Sphingomonas abietis]|uniref:DUF4136 domain-containing protein n=1 Tax=Sphingomonas abietis TaxID=3012344 RepID=A0ABY7NQ68_9SPHN|nr:hypothetical protein [Sphingomonas abietis]WBO23680.1 hypothetical protein PBT88_06045 [Sphingomonas abietis]